MARMSTGDIWELEIGSFDGVTHDVNKVTREIASTAVPQALKSVASELTNSLKQFIQSEVYERYEPKNYPRRADYPRFGYGLADDKYIDYDIKQSGTRGANLTFMYNPKGYHYGKIQDIKGAYETKNGAIKPTASTSRNWDKPLKPHPVHGDRLINRIQTAEGFDWHVPDAMPARPFWNMFVDHAKNDTIAFAFSRGFRSAMADSDSDFWLSPSDIDWEGGESMLEGETSFGANYIPDSYGDSSSSFDASSFDGDPLDF